MIDVSVQHTLPGFDLDVSFSAPSGVTVLFGRSGSGKTTVVHSVAGLIKPDRARIRLAERVLCDTDTKVFVPPHRRRVGYVFQDARLFPHLNVRQNLQYGRFFSGAAKGLFSFDHVVGMLGLERLVDRRPRGLSGGEKQRVALGRVLLSAPDLILADEPLAALDQQRKSEILPYFERLRDEVKIPILYVTHAPAEVARLATTVVVLKDGKVQKQGSASQVLGDPDVAPAGVRGVGAVLEAVVIAHHDDGLSELNAGGVPLFLPRVPREPGRGIRVRIAAQDVLLSRGTPKGLSALNILPGRIEAIRPGNGPGAIVSLNTAAGRVLARVTQRSVQAMGLATGDQIHAVVKTVSVAPEDVGG
ncbi:MAG: molybdenum ABC transporter ATP-binding protein [Pelagimonas sp.]|jgi:molybdate transport system ATP-binding protein|nr:molybdenum ABC transporter ATP-binding protein [Pelagimonas sp.]